MKCFIMNLDPINPYQIIEGLKEENEGLKAENESLKTENEQLKKEVAEYAVVETTSNG